MSAKFGAFINAAESAARSGDCANVRILCEREFINERDTKSGRAELHWACNYGNDDLVKYLLSEGADIDIESIKDGWRPIHIAAACGHTSVMTTLIERGCSLDCVNKSEWTPLDLAIKNKREECVRILRYATEKRKTALKLLNENSLSKIVDIERGRTVLDELMDYRDVGIMKAIQSKRVDEQEINDWLSQKLRQVDPQSYRLLHQCLLWRCIRHKYDDGVYRLCTAEIVNTHSLFMGLSPLETAVEFGTVLSVKCIIDKLVQEDESWTRAAKVAKDKNLSNISSMISDRINYINGKKAIGFTRLHMAVLDNDPDMVNYILRNKIVNPDEVHKIFGTAISMANSLNQIRCVEMLQNYNGNVNTDDNLRQSPLHVLINNGTTYNCDHLVNNMTDLEAKDYMNFTGLELGEMNNCKDMCELLENKGVRCHKNMDPSPWLDINRDSAVLLKNAPVLPITEKETIYSLCIKINRTIYPCLVESMDKRAVDCKDGEDNTILHLCAIFLLPRLCSEMILKSANVNSINNTEGTPLNELLKYHYGGNMEQIGERLIETVNVLIKGGASLNVKDYTGRSIIDRATEFHNEKLLLTLIQKKERLECVLEPQLTTWLRDKYFTMIKEVIPLLNKSLITNDIIGNVLTENESFLTMNLYDHASYDVKTTVVETILYKMASDKDYVLFDHWIKDDISTSSSLECGESLLICLIRDKNESFIQRLLQSSNASSFLEKKNMDKKLPLHICIECEYWDVLTKLMFYTKSVNEEDNDGNTALSLLLEKFSENVEKRMVFRLMYSVKMLIRQSADIYQVNKHGRTAISYCTQSHVQSEIESYFRSYQDTLTTLENVGLISNYEDIKMVDLKLLKKLRSLSKSDTEQRTLIALSMNILTSFYKVHRERIFRILELEESLSKEDRSKVSCLTMSMTFLSNIGDSDSSEMVSQFFCDYLRDLKRYRLSRPGVQRMIQKFMYALYNISRIDDVQSDDDLASILMFFFTSYTKKIMKPFTSYTIKRIKIFSAYLLVFLYNRKRISDDGTMIIVLDYIKGVFDKMNEDKTKRYLGMVWGEREMAEISQALYGPENVVFISNYKDYKIDHELVEKLRCLSNSDTEQRTQIALPMHIISYFYKVHKERIFTKLKVNECLSEEDRSKLSCLTLSMVFLSKIGDSDSSETVSQFLCEYLRDLGGFAPFSRVVLTTIQIFLYALYNISRINDVKFNNDLASTFLIFFTSNTNERIKLHSAYLLMFLGNRNRTRMIDGGTMKNVLDYIKGVFDKMDEDKTERYLGMVRGEREIAEMTRAQSRIHLLGRQTTTKRKIQIPEMTKKEIKKRRVQSKNADSTRQADALSIPTCSISVNEPINLTVNCDRDFCMTCAE